jgi:hypothetical protein
MKDIKSTRDMRSFLLEQMQGVAEGVVDLGTAKGVANLSQQVYNTINIELKVAQAKEKIKGLTIDSVKFDD